MNRRFCDHAALVLTAAKNGVDNRTQCLQCFPQMFYTHCQHNVLQIQHHHRARTSLPSWLRGFDSLYPLQYLARFGRLVLTAVLTISVRSTFRAAPT